jgi:hypothetical protein
MLSLNISCDLVNLFLDIQDLHMRQSVFMRSVRILKQVNNEFLLQGFHFLTAELDLLRLSVILMLLIIPETHSESQ